MASTTTTTTTWKQAQDAVNNDSDNLERWEHLLAAMDHAGADAQRGEAAAVREVYDRLLTKFPLLYGYWIKYVQLERDVLGGQGTYDVLERAVCAFPNSQELWLEYLATARRDAASTNTNTIRMLFERAVARCGRQFLSHELWDMYLEFEQSVEAGSIEVARVLRRLAALPLHQHARYYEQWQAHVAHHPEHGAALGMVDAAEFEALQRVVSERYRYEAAIRRAYFHVLELELEDVDNWNDYLDYMERTSTVAREDTRCVYEQCLVPCALYDVFWLRYVRWLSANDDDNNDEEETRNAYRRAALIHVPSSRPWIRLQWALFEESTGDMELARDIYSTLQGKKIQQQLARFNSSSIYTDILIQRVFFEMRTGNHNHNYNNDKATGPDNAIQYMDRVASFVSSSSPVTAALAALMHEQQGRLDRAAHVWRDTLPTGKQHPFWCVNRFEYALRHEPLQAIHELWQALAVDDPAVPPVLLADLSQQYLERLAATCADPSAAQKYMEVDLHVNFEGIKPPRPAVLAQRENGHPGVLIDPVDVRYGNGNGNGGASVFEPLLREQGIKVPKQGQGQGQYPNQQVRFY